MKKMILSLPLIFFGIALFAQGSGSVKGRVTDKQTNAALPGATITIKGTKKSAITDYEGYFILQKLKAGKEVLSVTYVGYEDMEVAVEITDDNMTNVSVNLNLDNRIGSEVVV